MHHGRGRARYSIVVVSVPGNCLARGEAGKLENLSVFTSKPSRVSDYVADQGTSDLLPGTFIL